MIPIKSQVSVVQDFQLMSNFETREYEKEDNATLSSFFFVIFAATYNKGIHI